MKYFVLLLITSVACSVIFAQPDINKIINSKEVERIERILSADDMMGRRSFSAGIDKAAAFIGQEFKAAGLDTWNKSDSYLQTFVVVRPKFLGLTASVNDVPMDTKKVIIVTSQPEVSITESSGFELVKIGKGANLFAEAYNYVQSKKNYMVLVDTSFSKTFGRLGGLKRQLFKSASSVLFLLTNDTINRYSITAKHEITENMLSNVVAVLPGKSKKNEYVIFSGHYDHLGVGKPVEGDSIFNGANDDAAGTTAVIMLAKYFKALNSNERTLVFAAFTAEEIGGAGSQYFSQQFDPATVVAMFNIEMIGTESKWGTNSAYITGYEKTDMGKILENNLKESAFTFYPDPYPDQQLFYRSDNATLARLGVPAHTVSTSKMDSEKFYHTVNDEIETLDMNNMAQIIKAIAVSAGSIISGKDSPSRVNTKDLER
jgi:Zn-dependent M28 family amino/carboxypeptidase